MLERLALISLGRASGFSLDEIALMFAPDGRPRIDRQMLRAKAEELDRTIRRLTEMRDGLRHAAACRAPSHMECPTFRRILRAAASGVIGARRRNSLRVPLVIYVYGDDGADEWVGSEDRIQEITLQRPFHRGSTNIPRSTLSISLSSKAITLSC